MTVFGTEGPTRSARSGFCSRLLAVALLFAASLTAQAQPVSGAIPVLTIDGAIGPALSAHIQQGLADAQAQGAMLVVLQLDTPGGLDTAMRDIIQSILDSDIPVVTYVSPPGARAASAGTYILYASHVAAMAPGTNLGAATPVQIGLPSLPDAPARSPDQEGQEAAGASSTMERKVINDASAYIRALAELHGRNALWAETAVTEAASIAASEALAEGVIDIMAGDLTDLLAQLHGRELAVKDRTVTLDTAGKPLQYVEMSWQMRMLMVLTNPSLIVILGMIGLYGLVIEFYSPGFGFGGVVGIICLLLAGYGLQLLPVNYAGLGLILLGLVLIVAEAFLPSFGILGIGGIIAFMVGGVMLVDTELDVFRVSLPLLLAIVVFFAGLIVATLRVFLRVKHSAPVTGLQMLIGQIGESAGDFAGQGMVRIQGELWQAHTDTPLRTGDKVRITGVDDLHLRVTRV